MSERRWFDSLLEMVDNVVDNIPLAEKVEGLIDPRLEAYCPLRQDPMWGNYRRLSRFQFAGRLYGNEFTSYDQFMGLLAAFRPDLCTGEFFVPVTRVVSEEEMVDMYVHIPKAIPDPHGLAIQEDLDYVNGSLDERRSQAAVERSPPYTSVPDRLLGRTLEAMFHPPLSVLRSTWFPDENLPVGEILSDVEEEEEGGEFHWDSDLEQFDGDY